MKVIECSKIDVEKHDSITFLRIEPDNISVTLRDIIVSLSDMSWIANFDKAYIRGSFKKRAEDTAKYLEKKLLDDGGGTLTEDSGEYIVSELAREALVSKMGYLDIPLAELFKKKISGNPGFDFYSANNQKIIIFGEAKYNARHNAYGVGMEQVDGFIKEEQDIADLNDIDKFFEEISLEKAYAGDKAYAIAFSSKQTTSERIIKGIVANKHYSNIAKHKEVVFLAVNI